jgi:uncharacterized membrane protein YfcA
LINLSILIKSGVWVAAGLTIASFASSIWTAATAGNFTQIAVAAIFLCVALSMWWQKQN